MKKIFWKKVQNDATWWEKLDAFDQKKEREKERMLVQESFKIISPVKTKKAVVKTVKKVKKTAFSIFDSKKQGQMGPVLKKLKRLMTSKDLRASLLNLDVKYMTEDVLEMVRHVLPDEEEAKKITEKPPGSDFDEFTKYASEAFLGFDYVNRVDTVDALIDAPIKLAKANGELEVLKLAFNEIATSPTLQKILGVALFCGNTVNSCQDKGFKISCTSSPDEEKWTGYSKFVVSDNKFGQLKGNDQNGLHKTMMHTIAMVFRKSLEHNGLQPCLKSTELKTIDKASLVITTSVCEDVYNLDKEKDMAVGTIAKVKPGTSGREGLLSTADELQEKVKDLHSHFDAVLSQTTSLMTDFGEDLDALYGDMEWESMQDSSGGNHQPYVPPFEKMKACVQIRFWLLQVKAFVESFELAFEEGVMLEQKRGLEVKKAANRRKSIEQRERRKSISSQAPLAVLRENDKHDSKTIEGSHSAPVKIGEHLDSSLVSFLTKPSVQENTIAPKKENVNKEPPRKSGSLDLLLDAAKSSESNNSDFMALSRRRLSLIGGHSDSESDDSDFSD